MSSFRTIPLLLTAAMLFWSAVSDLCAQETDSTDRAGESTQIRFRWEGGGEGYMPTDEDRQLSTINLNGSLGIPLWRRGGLWLYGGLTATLAWGKIRQANGSSPDTAIENSAAGLGPFLMLRWTPLTFDRLSLSLNASEGIILYSGNFPSGGDMYNFMGRLGADVVVQIEKALLLNIGARWMHVSNGQGLGTFNPSYEGVGFALSLSGGW